MAETMTKTKTKRKRNVNNTAYVCIIPFVLVFCIFSVYPVFRVLYLSFTDFKGFGEATFNGVANYIRVLQDKYFWQSIWHTIKIWSVNIVLQLGLAFLLTIVFSDIKYKIRGLGFYRAVYYLPNIIAATSIALLFANLLDWRYGTLNQILRGVGVDQWIADWLNFTNGIKEGFMGLMADIFNKPEWIVDIPERGTPINWLGWKETAPMVISLIQTWIWFGNSFIMLMAGVQGINNDYFEAAAIDGAGRWKRFTKITLPLLKPIMLYVAITSFIGGLQMFDLPFLMCGGVAGNPGGETQTVVMYLYKFGFAIRPKQVGFASAIAYVLFLLILIVSIIQFKVMNKKED